ncbi:UNKNOWN [Stylonychia lemnae]|uniref:Uncharacterized protein n=1 Tax=Stylonychia lemnae TaxID=5949 RepID=A0A077ZTV8_STYLE|nr:UNKNOWN [Stylonychia lemnae]|eukprot:CDW72760.1 UNKNOWN [Stylonychia lemnae]
MPPRTLKYIELVHTLNRAFSFDWDREELYQGKPEAKHPMKLMAELGNSDVFWALISAQYFSFTLFGLSKRQEEIKQNLEYLLEYTYKIDEMMYQNPVWKQNIWYFIKRFTKKYLPKAILK